MTEAPGAGAAVEDRARQGRRPGPSAGSGRRAGRGSGARRADLLGYLLVAPLVAVMLLVIGFPLVNTVLLSLQDQRVTGSESSFVGFATFATVLADGAFWRSVGRSGVWLVGNLVLQTVFALATALLLTRRGVWARTARTWVLLPWVIPTVAVSVIWQWLLNTNYGIVTKVLGAVGIDLGGPFADSSLALAALIFVNSWHWFPLGAVVIYGALSTVPHEVVEAARMDGANVLQVFWHVTLPLLQPILFALGLVGSLWSFNIVDSIYLVTQGGPADATTTAPIYIYDRAFSAFQASQAAAASVVTIVLLGIVTAVYIKAARPKEDA
jgi:multiple sugar transport system permease protein